MRRRLAEFPTAVSCHTFTAYSPAAGGDAGSSPLQIETAVMPPGRRCFYTNLSRARAAAARPKRVKFDGTHYFLHDAEGNRTAKYKSATGALDATATDITTYAWDDRRRMTELAHRAAFASEPDEVLARRRNPCEETNIPDAGRLPKSGGRIAFVSPHCLVDFSNGAATATRDGLGLLAAQGFDCMAFCGTRLDAVGEGLIQEQLFRRKINYEVRKVRIPAPVREQGAGSTEQASRRSVMSTGTRPHPSPLPVGEGSYDARLILLVEQNVPVTLFENGSTRGGWLGMEEANAFLAACDDFLRRNKPDIVVTYGGDLVSIAVQRLARRHGARIVFWLHNFGYADRAALDAADCVVVPSEFARAYYRERLGLDCHVLPNVVDPERVNCGASCQAVDKPADWQSGPRFVTFVNPTPLKGVFIFARIAKELSRRRPDIPLLVVEALGNADLLPSLGIDLSGLKNVRLIRASADPRTFYSVTRLVLMPSLVESAGLVAMEAMTNGIPVLASNRGALPETICGSPHPNPLPEGEGTTRPHPGPLLEGEGGFLFDIPDRFTPASLELPSAEEVAPWVEAIIRLWDDADYYEQCSRAARERGIPTASRRSTASSSARTARTIL